MTEEETYEQEPVQEEYDYDYGPPPRPRHTKRSQYEGRRGYIYFGTVPYPTPSKPFKLKPLKIKPVNPFKEQYKTRRRRY